MLNSQKTPSSSQQTADSVPLSLDPKAAMQRKLQRYMEETKREFSHMDRPEKSYRPASTTKRKKRTRSPSITPAQIDEILALSDEGRSTQQITRKVGLSMASVQRVTGGRHAKMTPEQRQRLALPSLPSLPNELAAKVKTNNPEPHQVVALYEEQIAVLQTENRSLRQRLAALMLP